MLEESLSELIDRWRAGDQSAATEIYNRFYQRLVYMVAPRIRPDLRRKLQPESVVLFVMEVMLRRIRAGAIPVASSAGFLRIARTIAEHRICNEWEHWTAKIRDILREVCQDDESPRAEPSVQDDFVVRAAMADLLEKIRQILPADHFQVLQFLLDGYSQGEIAEKLAVSRHTVARLRKNIAERLGSAGEALWER